MTTFDYIIYKRGKTKGKVGADQDIMTIHTPNRSSLTLKRPVFPFTKEGSYDQSVLHSDDQNTSRHQESHYVDTEVKVSAMVSINQFEINVNQNN